MTLRITKAVAILAGLLHADCSSPSGAKVPAQHRPAPQSIDGCPTLQDPLRVTLAPDEVWLETQRVRPRGHPAFAEPAHREDLTSLTACLERSRRDRAVIHAAPETSILDLVAVVDEIQAAGVARWSLVVGSRGIGTFAVAKDEPTGTVSDATWDGTLHIKNLSTAHHVEMILDYQVEVGDRLDALRRADGKALTLRVHTGVF